MSRISYRSFSIPDDDGRILDRLRGLEQIISAELIRQVLFATGRTNPRACALTHEITFWVILAMGILTDLPIRQVFKHARRLRHGEPTPARSSLCEARQRLGVEPLRELFDRLVRPLATPETPGAFFRGRRLMAFDGTILDAPDSDANAAAFDRANGGRGEGAFPQVRKVSLVELGTHCEVALAVGGWQDGERELALTLAKRIPDDALLLVDRGFYSYDFWKTLDSQGVALIARVKSPLVLKPVQELADGSFLAWIYPDSHARQQQRDGILVRVIEYTLDDPQRVGHGEMHRQITNVLDPDELPALEWVILYHERWEIELVYDEQKTHQDPIRAEKPAHLRSQTPEGVHQEVLALSLGHYVTRALMVQAAQERKIDPDRLSFKGCLQILRCRLPEGTGQTEVSWQQWLRGLVWEMSQEIIEPRRNRVNPRVVKRKMSKYARKRPHHRHLPPLRKTFAETVVIP
jgi:hypothetical protein